MKSRALPKDFDFTQSLQPAYGDHPHSTARDTSFRNSDLVDCRDRSMLPSSHQTMTSPNSVPMSYNNLPNSGSKRGLVNPSPFSPTNDALSIPTVFQTPKEPLVTTTLQAETSFAYSNDFSAGSHSQRRMEIPSAQSAKAFGADSLFSPTAQSSHQNAVDTHRYGDRSTMIPRMPFRVDDASLSNVLIQNQNPTEYSPAAESARYTTHPSFHSKAIENNGWQASQGCRSMENEQQLGLSHPHIHLPSSIYPNEFSYPPTDQYDT